MGSRKIVFDDDNPEWTAEDFARARPAKEVLPPKLYEALTRGRGPQKAPVKTPVSIRLSTDVLEHFRATGPGWQARIDDALKQMIARKIA
jgi:uncharacterized protein (DUF4415 family)